MTTIAYKDGIIAWDSRITANNFIVDDDYDKHIVIADTHFFVAGATEFSEDFCNAYAARSPTVKDMEVGAIVVEANGKLFKSSVEESGGQFRIWRSPYRQGCPPFALGSGHDFAIAFMDMGLTAEEAVQRVMKFDAATGGKVHTFQVPVAVQHVPV